MSEAVHHITNMLPFKIALIGTLGIGAQWLAWRLQRPAIVLMSIAGLIFGPLLGWLLTMGLPGPLHDTIDMFWLDPVNDFGPVYRPMIGIAVAIILFEGGLNLRFKDLGDSAHAVGRMVFFAAPIAWGLGTLAAHHIVGLPWDIAAMVGGLFVVTGPTVIMPLLRQAHLKSRPANILKWEGIVNDPLGALFAVGGYEFIRFSMQEAHMGLVFGKLIFAAVLGTVVGIISGYGLAWAFRRGHIPEYLKAPVVLAWVLAIYVLANNLADETGLLAVTALGMTMANTKFASMVEMRRFKENIAIILVSGVFVILTATLTPDILKAMITDWRIPVFVIVMMLFVRPIAVMISTLWSGVSWRESLLVSLIAPRGVVAVAVAGLFAAELLAIGRADGVFQGTADGDLFVPLAFSLVFATVLFAGFAITPLSKALGLAAGGGNGVLIVGANPWSLGLAKALKSMDIGVLVADTNWRRLRGARLEAVSRSGALMVLTYGGDIDRLAREGLTLNRFYAMPICTPTRSALMTARDPMKLGTIYAGFQPWQNGGVSPEEHFMPQSFQSAGYQTAMIGKWHLGHTIEPLVPTSRGFDHFFGHLNTQIDYYDYSVAGGYDLQENGKSVGHEGEYATNVHGNQAERYINDIRDPNKPFFLYVPFLAPHSPMNAKDEDKAKYPNRLDTPMHPAKTYAAMVDSMDQAIGQILTALDEQGVADNTIVLFFTDNGGYYNFGGVNTPLRGGKLETYEGGVRVNAVLRWPDVVPPNTVNENVISVMDLFPTLTEAAGIEAGNVKAIDGVSRWDAVTGTGAKDRGSPLVFTSGIPIHNKFQYGVLDGPWKLIQDVNHLRRTTETESQVFNVWEDPNEETDLMETHPDQAARLQDILDARLALHPAGGTYIRIQPHPGWRAPKDYADVVIPADKVIPEAHEGFGKLPSKVLQKRYGEKGRIAYE